MRISDWSSDVCSSDLQADSAPSPDDTPFGVEERNMVSGVLRLADRNVHSIMTPRTDISWIDLDDDPEDISKKISDTPHGFFHVCSGSLDDIVGIGRATDMITYLVTQKALNVKSLRPPILVQAHIQVLN